MYPFYLVRQRIIEKIKQNTFKIRTTISIARIEVEYLNSHIVKHIYIINKTIVLSNPNIKIISKTLAWTAGQQPEPGCAFITGFICILF